MVYEVNLLNLKDHLFLQIENLILQIIFLSLTSLQQVDTLQLRP